MTSRRSSDRTARADSPQRRPTVRRGIKKRGILPSFGDIVLPIVSVAAVGLLVLAGRQFFLNGLKTSPGIASTRAYAEAPALIAERERKQEKESEVSVSVTIAGMKNENASLDAIVKQEIANPRPDSNIAAAVPEAQKQVPVKVSQTAPAKKPAPAPAKLNPSSKPQPAKQPAKTQTPAKTQQAKTTQPAKTASTQKKTEPQKKEAQTKTKTTASSSSSSNQWRVQIGAYTSKSGAQEAANKLKKAGYTATVYSNPASKHHKVWVSGGADKKSAERVVNAMKKLGYGSSFAFPPSK